MQERIFPCEGLGKYIPDFSYELVALRDYSNRELLDRQDEISVVMLFNKLQGREDIADIRSIPSEEFQRILANTPPYLLDLMAQVVRSFLTQMDIPEKDAEQTVAYIKEGAMGKLFANVEPIHVYYERKMAEKDALAARQLAEKLAEKDAIARQLAEKLAEKDELAAKQLAEKDVIAARQLTELAEKDELIASLQKQLQELTSQS